MTTYYVHLGGRAEIWTHHGYTVVGEAVRCWTRADALRIVRETHGATVGVTAPDGQYRYASRRAARADRDGTGALARIEVRA